MPKYVNPNTYPVNLSISQPVAVNLVISPHSWPASRLAYNAQQFIDLPESVARNFTAIGMLAPAPEDGTVLTVAPPRPPDDKKVALTTRLPDNPDFDEDDFGKKTKRPATLSTKVLPPAIPKGKGTYVVAELPDKRILFLSGPVLQEVGLQRFDEHYIGFPNSGYTRLSLVYGDNEEEASRSRRYGHFLEKVIKEYPLPAATPATLPPSTATAAALYENLSEIGEPPTAFQEVGEPAEPTPEKKQRARKPKAAKPPKTPEVEVETAPGSDVFVPNTAPEVSPKVTPKFAPPVSDTPKPKAVFSFKPKPKVVP